MVGGWWWYKPIIGHNSNSTLGGVGSWELGVELELGKSQELTTGAKKDGNVASMEPIIKM